MTRSMYSWILSAIAIVLAIFRIYGEKGEVFQAIAHLFVGGLIGAYIVGRKRFVITLSIGLSVVELSVFLWQKTH